MAPSISSKCAVSRRILATSLLSMGLPRAALWQFAHDYSRTCFWLSKSAGRETRDRDIEAETYAMDQPTSVKTISKSKMLRLTRLNTFPCPRRESRVSALMHRSAITKTTTAHAREAGRPGYLLMVARKFRGG